MRVVACDGSFEGWRGAVRDLLAQGIPPAEVAFSEGGQLGLLSAAAEPRSRPSGPSGPRVAPRVPAAFVSLARRLACHRDPSRWDRLYRVLWRTVREGAAVLDDAADPDVHAVSRMALELRHDIHRVHALVRFRRVLEPGGAERWLAFHRPDHRVLPLAAPFFARRFAAMRWSILTPDASAHWDGLRLTFGPGVARDACAPDDLEALWRAYYATTFNPARVNPRLLRAHLPERHRATLPEARDIAALVRGARPAVAAMTDPEARGDGPDRPPLTAAPGARPPAGPRGTCR